MIKENKKLNEKGLLCYENNKGKYEDLKFKTDNTLDSSNIKQISFFIFNLFGNIKFETHNDVENDDVNSALMLLPLYFIESSTLKGIKYEVF